MCHFCRIRVVRRHKSFLRCRAQREPHPFDSAALNRRSCAPNVASGSAGRKAGLSEPPRSIASPGSAAAELLQQVMVSALAPLSSRRHSRSQLLRAPFDPLSRISGIRQRSQWQGTQSTSGCNDMCRLTPRSSGRAKDKVPSSNVCARAAQLRR